MWNNVECGLRPTLDSQIQTLEINPFEAATDQLARLFLANLQVVVQESDCVFADDEER